MKKTFLSIVAIICLAWSTSEGSAKTELKTQRLYGSTSTLVTLWSQTYPALATANSDFSKADKITSMTCTDPSTNTSYTAKHVGWTYEKQKRDGIELKEK